LHSSETEQDFVSVFRESNLPSAGHSSRSHRWPLAYHGDFEAIADVWIARDPWIEAILNGS
jgi:hypothetical protein